MLEHNDPDQSSDEQPPDYPTLARDDALQELAAERAPTVITSDANRRYRIEVEEVDL